MIKKALLTCMLLLLPLLAACQPDRAEFVYSNYCAACHGVGAAGAPLPGEKSWSKRALGGIDDLVAIARTGTMSMPPRGRCIDCSDDDLRQVIEYMINP